jgi:EmrB/QacA subfamily drug resistance transporter
MSMTDTTGAPLTEGRRILIAFIVACAFLMQGIDTTLLTIAIPTIADSLGVDPLLLHLPITGYLLSLAVFMPVSGWFADRFGARLVFCAALMAFTFGSLMAALAPDLPLLVAARVLQGFGGALMTPVGRLLVLKAFGPGRTLDAMTYLTLPVLIGPLLGPLLGATIISFTSWRWLFIVNVPVCIITVLLTLRFVPRLEKGIAMPFDIGGFVLVGVALVLFQLGVEHMAHPILGSWGTGVIFVVSLIAFWAYTRMAAGREGRALDLTQFARKPFFIGVLAGGIGRIGLNASAFLLPLLLQIGFGMQPIAAAALASLSAVGAFAAKPLLRRAIKVFGYGPTLVMVAAAGGLLMASFCLMDANTPIPVLVAAVLALGGVRTMHFNAVNSLTYSDVPEDKLSVSVASAGVFQQLSMGLGVSVSAALLSMLVPGENLPTIADFQIVFLFMAVVPILTIPLLLSLGGFSGRRKVEKAA